MKKFVFLAAAAMLMGHVRADEPGNAVLDLEKEAEALEAWENPKTFSDPNAAEAWKKRRESVMAARYESYQNAVKKKGRGFLDAINPPECKYYSTEGVCLLPRTRISPYPEIAHVNTDLNFKFPKKLGSSTARYITVYPMKELGYSIKYTDDAADVFADIYVYDIPGSSLPVSVFNQAEILTEELYRAISEIDQMHPNARFDDKITPGYFTDEAKTFFLCIGADYDSNRFNKQKTMTRCYSFVLLFAKNQKFIKMRITRGGGTPDEFAKFINVFLADFDRKVILDSQNRKRKFEKAVTHPIINPY